MKPSPNATSARTRRRGRLLGTLTALTLAGCNWGTPAQPTMTLGAPVDEAVGVPLPQLKPNGRAGGDFFLMALPPEAPLPKEIIKVVGGGAAGSLSKKLSSEKTPVVTNVIPNGRGFIFEGASLNKASVKFLIGSTEMTVVKRLPHQVVVVLPKSYAQSSGIITVRDGTTQVTRLAADAKNVYVTGRVVVRFREGAPRQTVEAGLLAAGITYYRYPGMNYVVAYHTPDQTFETIKTKLLAQPVFDQITRDTIFYGKAAPTDPRYSEQWALPKINAPAGWSFSSGSPDVIVAILDTGVNLAHPDLAGSIHRNLGETAGNNVDDDGNGRVDDVYGWNSYDQTGIVEDDNGHGTEMAGLIAAQRDNGIGIVGLAYASRILPCKVSNAEGLATSSTVIDGINYAVRNRASIINMSLASNIDDAAVKAAIDFATTFNATVVCAMGNDGNYIKQYPAAWSKDLPIISVGATNSVDARPAWGTYGEWMTVCAPGEALLTTARGGGYTVASGTSHAAAHVSALAALIKSLKPGWTPLQVRDMITKTAIDRGVPGFDNYYGWGRITLDTTALGGLLQQVLGNLEVDASSQHQSGYSPPELVLDKNSETAWVAARTESDQPRWLTIDLTKMARITSIAALPLAFRPELFPADFTIEVSDDGENWRTVATERDFQAGEGTWSRWNITPTWCHYVRFNITRSRTNPDNGLHYAIVAEVAFNGEELGIVKNSSSSFYGIHYATSHLTDKDPLSFWASVPRGVSTYEYAIADLGVSRSFKNIRLLSPPRIMSEGFPVAVSFYTSNDKINWTFQRSYGGLQDEPSRWYDFPIPTTTARYVRIDSTETRRAESHGMMFGGFHVNGHMAAIAEVEVQ